ncbi:MAG: Gfo/Idh/MocA family oxidoreductase [Bacteroidota bacterium]
MSNKTRRHFIKQLGLAGAAITTDPVGALSTQHQTFHYLQRRYQATEKEELAFAVIGAGGMGMANMDTALRHEGVKVVAACDLYQGRLQLAKEKWGEDIFVTDDYKAVLRRKEVDAVIIGTPDHWHTQIAVDALKAGKHVYCEKPMVHSVKEGHELIKAWRASGKVFMVGSQGLSSLGNEKARELLAQGVIGDLNYAEGFWARHSPVGAWQYAIPEDASEETVSWQRYLANTTQRAFDPLRFFRWRNYLDYGTGMSGDLFVHLFSSLHFITNSKGPNKIAALGGLRYWKDGREVPDVLLGMFDYPETPEHPGFDLSLRCNFVDGTSGTTYLRIVGSRGSMDVEWRKVTVRTNSISTDDPFELAKLKELGQTNTNRKKILPPSEMVYEVEEGYKGAHYDHHGNFIHAIRTGGTVVEDPVFGFRAAAPALLCNDSYFNNTFIHWDPVEMKVQS